MNKKIYQVLLLLFAFIVVFLLGGLIVLKIKDNKKEPSNNGGGNTVKEENNYVEEYNIEELLNTYKNISFNSNTELEGIKLYGLESLDINKITIEKGKLKYYSNEKEYTSSNIYDAKYIEYATDNKTYSELLVYTSYGVYYYNTNGNAEIEDEETFKEKFEDTDEKALYTLNDDVLNLTFIKLTNSYSINGISTIKNEDKSYFVVRTSSNTYVLDYTKTTKYGMKIITSVTIGDKLSEYVTSIGTIGKDKKISVNYDLSLKINDVLKYEEETIYPVKVYLTKDAYFFITEENDIYTLKLSEFENAKVTKYNTKEVEKITLDEEKTYQGETITSIRQYIKVLYKDASTEEIQ